jgi:hypothetical protein
MYDRPPPLTAAEEVASVIGRGAAAQQIAAGGDAGRGLHPSTFQLSISVFCGARGERRGYLGGVQGAVGNMRGS